MWFIEHEALFGGKRVWLKPGSQHLYGRVKPTGSDKDNEKHVFIDSKNVSRKHMMLKVSEVLEGDGTKLHARSQIEVTDLSGRHGTFIDGETRLLDKDGEQHSMILKGNKHTIKLGLSYAAFTIKWQPVTFTYASRDNRKDRTASLHALDIKTTSDFVYNQTTHVVSQKRNLPKVLQGLVTGTPIVTTDFLDTVLNVGTAQSTDPYVPSRLEEDFDTWWPKERDYVPPQGAEPVPRPGEMLQPDMARSEVFSGLTFIFLDEIQYNSLHEPIAGGGGKALFYSVEPGKTTAEEYVEYVKNVAGQKRGSKSESGSIPVITIRLPNFPDGMEEWATNFVTGVDQALNQRSIMHNEFLDAIVMKDTSALQKPPHEAMDLPSGTSQTSQVDISTHEPTSTSQRRTRSRATSQVPEEAPVATKEPTKTVPRKRPIRRGATTSRFTGFDDYDDYKPPAKIRKLEDTPMEDIPESGPIQESPGTTQSPSAGKTLATRGAPSQARPTIEKEEDDKMEELLPASAAMKRRLASRGPTATADAETQKPSRRGKTQDAEALDSPRKAKSKMPNQHDIREATRQRVQQEEEKRIADEESLREALQGVDISEVRNLVQIEDMEVLPRAAQSRQTAESRGSDRWNDEWNGRKNFKKFRRRGAERGPQHQKVFVALEEAPQRRGIVSDDMLVLEQRHQQQSVASRTAEGQQQEQEEEREERSRRSIPDASSEPEPGFVMRRKERAKDKQVEVINIEESELEEEEDGDDDEVVEVPATPRSKGTQRVAETQVSERSQTQRGTKRACVTVAAGPSKRGRFGGRDPDSDEEETGFRLRRRR